MSPNSSNTSACPSYSDEGTARSSAGEWLTHAEQRAWQAYMRLHMLMGLEINRQLQNDSGLSFADYEVLHALNQAPDGCMRINALANMLAWERSRISHQTRRMHDRGLVVRTICPEDHRATEVALTNAGREVLKEAAPRHVDTVRRLFFDGIPDGLLSPLTEALDAIRLNASRAQLHDSRTEPASPAEPA